MNTTSIKTKLIVAVSFLVIVIIAAVSYATLAHFETNTKELIYKEQFLMVSLVASQIDNKLTNAHQQLIEFSKLLTPEHMRNSDKAQELMNAHTHIHSVFSNGMVLFDQKGAIIAETPFQSKKRRGQVFLFRDYVATTLALKKPYIGAPYHSSRPHHHPVITLTVPIFGRQGELIGVLGGSIDLLTDTALNHIISARIGKTGYFYLITKQRDLILHPDQTRILKRGDIPVGANKLLEQAIQGFEGTGETVNSRGLHAITSFKHLKAKDWIVGANFPLAEAYAPVYQARRTLLLVVLVIIPLVTTIVWFLMNRLTRPLLAFTRHVEGVSGKRGRERFLTPTSADEIGRLTGAFNQMVIDLDRQQEELQESEAKFKNFAEQAIVGIYLWQDGGFKYVNPRFAEIFGYGPQELLDGIPFETLVFPKDLSLVTEQIKKRISGEIGYSHYEFRGVKKNGEIIHTEVYGSVTTYNQQPAAIGTLLDITERKKLETQLLQSQKMEAIGQLSGGIAHDFNNILSAIIGFGGLLRMKMSSEDPLMLQVKQILESAERGTHLTHSLLAFSRKQIIDLKPIDMNEVIKNIEKFLRRVIGEDIELKTKLADTDMTILADRVQMEQVLMNLATNARDAMPRGGRLTIGSEPVELDDEFIKAHGYGKAGRYILIAVTDTGEGMDEKTIEKIFEPFFTTKEVGRGTGLGLSIVYGIIKQHQGYINCYSELGQGTTFKIYLPLFKMVEFEERAQEHIVQMGGNETVLIAEDDDGVRRLTRQVLEEFGYTVIEAVNGEHAVEQFIAHKDKVNLLFLDVIMPRMNGKEAYEKIRGIEPGIKVLFRSGYPQDFIHNYEIDMHGLDFISKPVPPTEILMKIREVLDRK